MGTVTKWFFIYNHYISYVISRRAFINFCSFSLVITPFLGCFAERKGTDVSWFLSKQDIMEIGKSYSSNSFTTIDAEIVLINGWILTRTEAEVCKKKFLESA